MHSQPENLLEVFGQISPIDSLNITRRALESARTKLEQGQPAEAEQIVRIYIQAFPNRGQLIHVLEPDRKERFKQALRRIFSL